MNTLTLDEQAQLAADNTAQRDLNAIWDNFQRVLKMSQDIPTFIRAQITQDSIPTSVPSYDPSSKTMPNYIRESGDQQLINAFLEVPAFMRQKAMENYKEN